MTTRDQEPFLHLWYIKGGFVKAAQLLPQLPHHLAEKYQQISSQKRQHHFLYSRFLICRALSDRFKKPLNHWQLSENRETGPAIANLPCPLFISLSHSNQLICVAISNEPVGVDVQYQETRRQFMASAPFFMNSTELRDIPLQEADMRTYFYRTWCTKEAVYKALAPEKQAHNTLLTISSIKPKEFNIFHRNIDDYTLAIATSKHMKEPLLQMTEVVI